VVYTVTETDSNSKYCQSYYLRKIGNYMNAVILTGETEKSLTTMEGYFQ